MSPKLAKLMLETMHHTGLGRNRVKLAPPRPSLPPCIALTTPIAIRNELVVIRESKDKIHNTQRRAYLAR